ncbi:U7 snRNA-associated Sm-like protein LSm11 [Drosophila innubila]|uniref:U7 snRNA-associated Sm-like protein LSm11 n=1 Tax=Drosophila innubila TaxID=198719 RepID=UPI00148E82E4|nr:U7 snRNA-associated Sm-like protein LSm11 [Drosophila innubila]
MSDTAEKDETNAPEELDVGSERFNPLRALYAADYKVTDKTPKVLYQNIAAFESALTKVGVWELNKKQKQSSNEVAVKKTPSTASSVDQVASTRRFEPHQMAIASTTKAKHHRNLHTHMASAEGPLALLQSYLPPNTQTRVRVYLRKEHGVGGTIEGELVAFDKQWNLLLKNAVEIWQRRKYKYGEQKIHGTAASEECSARLLQLGISLPVVHVKSLSRKNVQLRREIPQLMVRGENVVLISCISNSKD